MAALDTIAAVQKLPEGALRGDMSSRELDEFMELLDGLPTAMVSWQKEIRRIQTI